MHEIRIDKAINREKLIHELSEVSQKWVLYPDNITVLAEADVAVVQGVYDAHTDTPTVEQAIRLARQSLSDGAVTSKQLWPLIKAFNDALEGTVKELAPTATAQEMFDAGYASWRALYDNIDNPLVIGYINGYSAMFNNPDDGFSLAIEPDELTNSYKHQFVTTMRDFLEYITDRAQT